jgi:hypothetical protein
MKLRLLFISTILILVSCHILEAQKVILLQKPGKTNWYMYSVGDKLSIRMGEPEFPVDGKITYIDDSICTVDHSYTFQISKVLEVTRVRPFLNGSWRTLYVAAFAYFGGSMLNHAINSEKPLVDNTVPYVSGSLSALGTTALIFRHKHCKMEDGWKLKVLDFDMYKSNYGPKE